MVDAEMAAPNGRVVDEPVYGLYQLLRHRGDSPRAFSLERTTGAMGIVAAICLFCTGFPESMLELIAHGHGTAYVCYVLFQQ